MLEVLDDKRLVCEPTTQEYGILIAAAPELLAAAEYALLALTDGPEGASEIESDQRAAREDLRKAIAKAKGKSS